MIHIEEEFDSIYRRYYPAILRYAMARAWPPPIAEEIANETLKRLWENRAACSFESETPLSSWIYKTASFVMREQYRATTDDASLDACENHLSDRDEIGERLEDMQYSRYIAEIEQRLTESERRLFRMIFVERKTYKQCAEEFHIQSVTMRAYISRLRKKLRPFIVEITKKTK